MINHDLFLGSLDAPGSWHFTSPEVALVGWICARNGRDVYTDVRVRLDGRIFHGIYGWDRPDVEAQLKMGALSLGSGFQVLVQPWRGARELRFEALNAAREWTEVFRTPVTTGAELPARPAKGILKTAPATEGLHYLYRHFHYRPLAAIRAEARRITAEMTTPAMTIHPAHDLLGHLDLPQAWVNSHYDKFRISGWLFAKTKTIRRITATLGVGGENRLIHGKEREDVFGQFGKDFPHALKSHYYGLVDIQAGLPSPACFKIWAEFDDGARQLAFCRRLFVDQMDENSGPIPVYSPFKFYYCAWTLLKGALLGRYRIDSWREFFQGVRQTRAKLAGLFSRKNAPRPAETAAALPWQQQDTYTRWLRHNTLSPRLRAHIATEAAALARSGPLISLVVPAYNTPAHFLEELLASVRGQLYPRWELCVADDASPQPHVRKILAAAARQDSRVKFAVRAVNGHICAATNSALELAAGEFVALLDHDDLLPPDALYHIAAALRDQPRAGMLYTDEDKIDESGRRYDPQFKGAWSPEMALAHNYTHHLTVIRRDLVEKAGRMRAGFEGAQDLDLFLRVAENLNGAPIVHVPQVCYHWRSHAASTASKGDQKGYLFESARRAIAEALTRRGLRAEPFLPEFARRHALCLHQLKWSPDILAENPVTLVIPTRNRADLLAKCLASLDRTVNWRHTRLIIVDDGSDDPATLDFLRAQAARADRACRVIRAGAPDAPFNYSRLVNLGAAAAETPLVLHLNNDIKAVAPGWLEELAGWFSIPEVGVVGARLLRPDETIDHAGLVVPPQGGLPHGLFVGLHRDDFGYLFWPHAARNVSAVTGACLMTRTRLYRELRGFDEDRLRVAYNDVDYCLRAAAAGYRTVCTPQASLTHLGSASRGRSYTEQEHLGFIAKYPGYRDPYFPEGLGGDMTDVRVAPHDFRPALIPKKLRVAVVTHNLKFEGAPLFIFEYARHLRDQAGFDVRVYSPEEGPLRAKFEEAGLPVTLFDAAPLLQASSARQFESELKKLAAADPWADRDLIVANTMVAFWAVKLAGALGKPSLLYVHESNSVRRFFARLSAIPAELHPVIEGAFTEATRVVFTARATQDIFSDLNRRDNYRLLDSWVDIERIERYCRAHDARSLRLKYGLDPDATLVVNIGSVCPRKGQHIYIRGIDALLKQHGAEFAGRGKIEFLIVGARDGVYLESIQQDVDLLGLKNVRFFGETAEIYDFYRLADIFCCTSFEESFPRVLLESAVFKLPIVTTDVNGIPEMLVRTDEAVMVPAGDAFKLAAALKTALDLHFAGDEKMTSMAFAHISRFYDARVSLARHVTMAREAYFT